MEIQINDSLERWLLDLMAGKIVVRTRRADRDRRCREADAQQHFAHGL